MKIPSAKEEGVTRVSDAFNATFPVPVAQLDRSLSF